MGHRGSCSRSSPSRMCWSCRRNSNRLRPKLNRSRASPWRCSQRCMHRTILTGHAPPEQPPRPVLRFASIQAAASWDLGWRSPEAAWSRRSSRWRHASHVAAAQTATRLLPREESDCRRRVGGRPGAPAATAAGRHRRGEKEATPSRVVHLPLEPVVAAALIGVARLGGGSHGARHARARAEAVGERAADGGQRQVVVGAARERHVQVALGQEVAEHRDVGEQVVAHLASGRVGEEEAARRPLAVHEARPVGEGVVVADDVRQVGVLLPAHVGQHHARCTRRYDCVDRGCGGKCQR
eukprot:scaffold67152_cov42-Phaeocystis_antarctica.AAC.1